DLLPALSAVRPADACKQQPHVVVDLGGSPYGRAGIPNAVFLANGNRRTDSLDAIDVRFLHALEELPCIGRQRLDVPSLPFRVDRVEGERGFPRSADTGDD